MLQDLNETLKDLVIERGKLKSDEIDITFDRPTSEWAATLGQFTINFFGYDLRENVKLRSFNMEADTALQQRRADSMTRVGIRRVPMRFDISYLVTAWAQESQDEYLLLWRALSALAPVLILRPEDCKGDLRAQPFDLPLKVAQMDETPNVTDLWSVLDNELRLGFTVTVTLALDPDHVVDMPLVLKPYMRIGQSESPRQSQRRRGEMPPQQIDKIDKPEIFAEEFAEDYRHGIPIKARGHEEAAPAEEDPPTNPES